MIMVKIKNYKGIVKFTIWYLKNVADTKGATSETILTYIEKNELLGYKMDTNKLGSILSDSKCFNQTRRYDPNCQQDKTHWTIKS